ncbi:MAG: hypothetical protein PWQ37_2044 [Candidatus Petromonas sp.]|jgi:uncharacterized protein|nr:hypothetical protein [Candidatus Petromonas sp.]
MKINLSQLVAGKIDLVEVHFSYTIDDENILKQYDIVEATPFHFSGKIYKKNEEFHIDADFSGVVTFRCNRCLNDFKQTIDGKLFSNILISDNFNEQEDEKNLYLKEDILDLSTIIEETITLSLPMKVVCSKECKGLCASCGANLNETKCNCNQEKIDPRLEKLKIFFNKDKEV